MIGSLQLTPGQVLRLKLIPCTLALLVVAPFGAAQGVDETSEAEIPTRAAAALEARCATCHTPGSESKKARTALDSMRDLPRLVEEWVIPGDLDGSDLWYPISAGEMPPEDSKTGPLLDEEREAIRAWILAGAPLPGQVDPHQAGGSAPDSEAAAGPEAPAGGLDPARLHILFLHFPIALLYAAALAELLVLFGGARFRTTAVFCLALAVIGAGLSSVTGWWLAEAQSWGPRAELLGWHRWAGIGTTSLAAVALLARCLGRGKGLLLFRSFLLAALLMGTLAGHYGGSLVHGEDCLPFPEFLTPHED